MKVAICTEDVSFSAQVEKFIRYYAEKNNLLLEIQCFSNPIALLETVNCDYRIFLLDPAIPQVKNRRLNQSLRKTDRYAYFIYLTSNLAIETYSVYFTSYLTTPVNQTLVNREMNKAITQLNQIKNDYIFLKNHEGYVKLYLLEIVYVETFNKKLLIHTLHGEYSCVKKISELEQELGCYPFVRCHNSYIVNMNYIRKICSNEIELESSEKILVSKCRKKEVIESFLNYVKSV
ncbi:LytTR family DNA-binding domain-containing protein [Paenibacillus sp. FSL H7-0350]|uniref:LytR/AlgR family response regulator transcription factor n=1 Tax=Paenibacillus sp. FSL H7-0350 TaxID=2975345 RepID=UPI003158EFF7